MYFPLGPARSFAVKYHADVPARPIIYDGASILRKGTVLDRSGIRWVPATEEEHDGKFNTFDIFFLKKNTKKKHSQQFTSLDEFVL